jgi:hypothetical protein
LWVRCGTYSAAYGLDGVVPARVARDRGSRRDLAALASSGLWVETADGFLLPDFLEFNPSRAEVDERRKADAERKRRGRNGVEQDGGSGQFVARANGHHP